MTFIKKGRWAVVFVLMTVVATACGTTSGEDAGTTSTGPTTGVSSSTTSTETSGTDEPSNETTTSVPVDTTIVREVPEGVDVVIEVTMDEFSFDPAPIEVQAGLTYLFAITNEGLVPHEFRLSNPHRIDEHLAAGHEDHHDGDGGHHEEGGDVFIELEPGESGELMMVFPADATLYSNAACLLPGHFEAGMVTDVVYVDA